MFWNDTYKFVHMSIQCILYRLFYKEFLKASQALNFRWWQNVQINNKCLLDYRNSQDVSSFYKEFLKAYNVVQIVNCLGIL
jgi:hypothetical protein